MSGQHTPGPWVVGKTTRLAIQTFIRVNDSAGRLVALVPARQAGVPPEVPEPERRARLMAEAPAMRALLAGLVAAKALPFSAGFADAADEAVRQARALLARIDGEAVTR